MTFLERFKKEVLPDIGNRMVRSVILNFKNEGRPEKWKPSKRALSEQRGKTLSLSGTLRNSISYKIKGLKLYIGTNVTYARIHQFGASINKTVTVKSHKRKIKSAFGRVLDKIKTVLVKQHQRKVNFKIPKRPFLMMQKSDINYIKRKLKSFSKEYIGSK